MHYTHIYVWLKNYLNIITKDCLERVSTVKSNFVNYQQHKIALRKDT